MIRSPFLGIDSHAVQNDSPITSKNDGGDSSKSLGTRLAGYFKKAPPTIGQNDIVLDKDLTVTSWKQLEQTGLVKVPGVMLWGSNRNGLVDPSGKSPGVVMVPQRLAAFEGMACRDLKLGDDIAAAVDEEGNVYQWGSGYNINAHEPEITLRNRDIAQVAICDLRLYVLSRDGTHVYVIPKVRPTNGPSKAAIDYVEPKPSVWRYVGMGGSSDSKPDPMTQLPVKDFLHKDEKITSIASGKNHMLMLTSEGRVLGSEDGLSVSTIGHSNFQQSRILEVACGDVHSLARDDQGRCWAWGTNGFGQLAQGAYSHANLKLARPTLIKDIAGSNNGAECVKVAAGGQTSFVVVKEDSKFKVRSAGMGQWGQLGDGTNTHIQGSLVIIAPLSNLAEYKENAQKMMPIGIHDFAIGSTHAFAVLDNAIAEDSASHISIATHGRDVLSWGQNTHYQLLTGKRINRTEPSYALPLDSDILQPPDITTAPAAQNRALGNDSKTSLDATNRLQLLPAQPRLDKQRSSSNGRSSNGVEMIELKIVAGNGVSGVYCRPA
ncbi:MAG: regulator of chromosome condensation 1/beta-lactamase-inhibitor protein II [Benniella sp.]|nr:MAG: regulator of chromosome condensation 1/beta-lactamase-inhibitor protein II [Benniella sp.]